MNFVLAQLSQVDGFYTLDLPCPAFPNVVLAGSIQESGDYTEKDYGGGDYIEGDYGYAS